MASPNRVHDQQFPRSMSFDQFGNVGGMPMSKMKLNEFLKNVISSDESHNLLQNVNLSSSSPSCSSSSGTSPLFQESFELINNGILSRKFPVDDVWKDIDNQERINMIDRQMIQQQFGDGSIEDLLVRSGMINIGNQNAMISSHQPIMATDPLVLVSKQTDCFQPQMAAVQQQQISTGLDSDFPVSDSVYENSAVDVGYYDNQLSMTMPMSAAFSESQVAEKKRRYSGEIMEKTIERKQKRMIKNRESAARSRARKQAYTNKLEHQVRQLQKTNNWLKTLKEQEKLLPSDPILAPRYQLQRTSSASF